MSDIMIRPHSDWLYVPCTHCIEAWDADSAQYQLVAFKAWSLEFSATEKQPVALWREYTFANFEGVKLALHEIMHLAEDEDHHPEVTFGYKQLRVKWSTHSASGVSDNDWACAAKLDNALAHIG